MLIGRAAECRRIDALLARARGGESGALVVVGEAGIGKSVLLDYARERAERSAFAVTRAQGVESEAELPFAALLDVCRPLLDRLDELPEPQAAALRAALALGPGRPGSRFAVAAATLGLLAATAERSPLLVAIDDAHWLDRGSADAIAFAARRLRADRVALLFATRPREGQGLDYRGLDELELAGLDDDAARELLARSASSALAPDVEDAVVEASGGNPLALVELPAALELDEAAGPAPLEEPLRVGRRIERAFASRVASLPEPTRRALVVCAATTSGELAELGAALAQLGLTPAELERAEEDGLVSLEPPRLAFRHPLVRSAIYHAAAPAERRAAHAALAAAVEDDVRAAWHRASATVALDDDVAASLERAAESARARSGFAAAAAAFERAGRLSESRDERLRRLAAAADAAWLGGRTRQALALIDEVVASERRPRIRGDLLHLRGTIEHFAGSSAAHRTLAEAAEILAPVDSREALVCLVEAVGSALFAGDVARAVTFADRAAEIADPGDAAHEFFASLVGGVTRVLSGRPEPGMPLLRRATELAEAGALSADPRRLVWAALAALWMGDGDRVVGHAGEAVAWAHAHGAVAVISFAARILARGQIMNGRWREAHAALAESLDAARLAGQPGSAADALAILAWLEAAQGRNADARAHAAEGLALADELGLPWFRGRLVRALLLLELGGGVVPSRDAVERLRRELGEQPLREMGSLSPLPDLVEALVRVGDTPAATEIFASLEADAARAGDSAGRALAARCRGLLAGDDGYDAAFQEALELEEQGADAFAAARTRLVYGERLRRSGRRVESREQLRAALAVFERLEAAPWVERARQELRATGERLQRRDPAGAEQLTPQELQVALLVAEGRTNREVGAQLFLSAKTVEWHLVRVYRKLGVRSRTELARVLAPQTPAPATVPPA